MTFEQTKDYRRVYVLSGEMMKRISDFQKGEEISSEVEAIRSLLKFALDRLDTPKDIVDRVKSKLQSGMNLHDALKDFIGHPILDTVNFTPVGIGLEMDLVQVFLGYDGRFSAIKPLYDKNDEPLESVCK